MKKTYQIIGMVILFICSIIYDYQKGEIVDDQKQEALSYVYLEGAFLYTGKYEFQSPMTIQQLIDEVGVKDNACLDALSLDKELVDESSLYLPINHQKIVSLNHATKDELMTLKRVGEKTALKIIEYRNNQPFTSIEEIMNISGIGEKTFDQLKDNICL